MEEELYQSEERIFLRDYVRCVVESLGALPWNDIDRALESLHDARLRRAGIFICGNGGSAATASHFTNDLNKGANVEGVPRFRAVALVDNTPLLTAWSNDSCYEDAFVEQLRNLVRPGDLVIGISGSGNSPNVLNAVRFARQVGAHTIGLTGGQGGKLAPLVDIAVVVPNACMEQIEDMHMVLEHAMVSALRDRARRERVPSLLLPEGWPARWADSDLAEASGGRRAVFLPQDGILVPPTWSQGTDPEAWELLPGALEAMQVWAHAGLAVVVFGGREDVAHQPVPYEIIESAYRTLMAQVSMRGGRIDAVAWCPHRVEEKCNCYAAKANLITYAAKVLHLDTAHSYLVGDSGRDIALGMAADCRTALVLTARGSAERRQVEAHWGARCMVLPDLAAATEWVLSEL
ncbi:MAG: hypothetical protein A2Y73_03850 [Chloroflexi bacterium RBG_13_56_8]|nr:MAG: hypothetical protein A2Y73_03850 [Chloroflexi bacterium RBG_13_56_8]